MPVPVSQEQKLYLVLNSPEKKLVACRAAFEPVLCHLAVLYGKLLEIAFGPFAVEIYGGRDALEPLCVQPLDAVGNRSNMWACDGAEGGGPEFHKPWDVLFDILETAVPVYGTARNVMVVLGAVEREKNVEFFSFAKIQELLVEKCPVRIDYEI